MVIVHCPAALGERDELGEQLALADELEPKRPADRQIVLDVLSERAHAALPGHGITTAASASRSTFA